MCECNARVRRALIYQLFQTPLSPEVGMPPIVDFMLVISLAPGFFFPKECQIIRSRFGSQDIP